MPDDEAANQPEPQPQQPPPGGYLPYYGPPPAYYQPPKKRKIWPWVLIGVVVLFFGGCLAVVGVIGSAIDTTSKQKPGAGATSGATMAGIGQEVRDGKFGFTVTNVSIAPTAGSAQARGEFVIVAMTVKNTGDEPRDYFASNQKLFDTAGRQFAADTMAITNNSVVVNLNPGFELNVVVPFDVPVGTTPAMLEVHDSAFSGGAKIKLN
ncbi:DUF4352 domain-containing protein [Mycobacterium marinum]|uniref:DUF4352 domain-containing protein n=1 Tax=Mycobacterium marinum TaxID=1781 RepID=UPI0021C3C604|nr:DUF4352 domain-containing protein [Mycobacterium marinum]MDC8971716.1 DUF4352 domain-containing protein [Mycobacterium marinum]GJO25565.1 Mpr protein [Mycobacterium marinum]